jgi:alpha-tubulin suppressor-like RCC1 family protein
MKEIKSIINLLLIIFLIECSVQKGFAQTSNRRCCWIASAMTGGANASTLRHFIRLADGSLWSFAPGGPLQQVKGIDHVVAVAAGKFDIVALKSDGTIWEWGDNDDGQLGNPRFKALHSDIPLRVPGIQNAIAVSTAGSASYALLENGTVMAWGKILHNGTGVLAQWDKPAILQGLSNVIALSGSIALKSDGTVWDWGEGQRGRLGNGSTSSSARPVRVKNISNAIAIAARQDGGMALLANGTVKSWGNNFNGELGNGNESVNGKDVNGSYSTVPVEVKGISNAIAISTNSNTCFALFINGSLMGWGDGRTGGLTGHKQHVNKFPVRLPLTNVVAVQGDDFGGFALLSDGTLMGWGSDMVAEGDYKQTYKPITIAKLGNKAPVK